MRRLILSEGKNDAYFLKSLIETFEPELEIEKFDMENRSMAEQRPIESNKIRKLISNYTTTEVLTKSEGGKPKLRQVFPSLIRDLANKDLSFYIVIDLDGGSFQNMVDDFNERISDRHPGSDIRIVPRGEESENEYIISERFNVVISDREIDQFYILAFKYNFDQIVDIQDECDREIIEGEIDEHIEDGELTEPFVNCIL